MQKTVFLNNQIIPANGKVNSLQ